MPPVNQMVPVGQPQTQLPWFPTEPALLPATASWCSSGWRSIPVIIFPPEYPYTSGMTKVLRDNFAELYAESSKMLGLGEDDLVDRHRLQRRHADLELPEGRPPHPRHRADRRVEYRQRAAASRPSSATSARTSRARSRPSTVRPRSSPRRTASPISRTCTPSSTASSRCSRRTACSSPNRTT